MVTALAVFAAACNDDGDEGDGGDDEAAIRALADAFVTAYNSADVDGFLALVTDNWLQEQADVTREEAPNVIGEFMGDPPIAIDEVRDIAVDGDTATLTVLGTEGTVLFETDVRLVRQNEAWLVDGEEEVPVAIPEGTTAVALDLVEFAFDYDASTITSGSIAFDVTNSGEQDHEVAVFSADPGVDVLAALQAADENQQEPEGVEFVAFSGPYAPGDHNTVVFTEPLAAGRYVLLCFFPDTTDPEETPHAFKGMISEFTVE
jgi:hypothetical protein